MLICILLCMYEIAKNFHEKGAVEWHCRNVHVNDMHSLPQPPSECMSHLNAYQKVVYIHIHVYVYMNVWRHWDMNVSRHWDMNVLGCKTCPRKGAVECQRCSGMPPPRLPSHCTSKSPISTDAYVCMYVSSTYDRAHHSSIIYLSSPVLPRTGRVNHNEKV